ncbi:MAG: dTDP-4-dehydrorhamnose 3,5-epimerase [Candidatus Micrarchaeaceae archaeon]
MQFENTRLRDVVLIRPRVFTDERGFFMETWQRKKFEEAGIDTTFVQENHSRSRYGVLRGLHYQNPHAQGKVVRVVTGVVFDVVVDLRCSSDTFGEWEGFKLDAGKHEMLWVPAGFAHGFLTLSEQADFMYQVTEFWSPESERTLLWNDPALAIDWPLPEADIILNDKDRVGLGFDTCPKFA